jgi:hypothetical protein
VQSPPKQSESESAKIRLLQEQLRQATFRVGAVAFLFVLYLLFAIFRNAQGHFSSLSVIVTMLPGVALVLRAKRRRAIASELSSAD